MTVVDQAAIRRQIAAGLRRARRKAGKSQEAVADAVAMSKSGLQHLEMARHSLRVEQLPVFAVAIGCTVRELLIEMRLVRRGRRGGTVCSTEDVGAADVGGAARLHGRDDGRPGTTAGPLIDGSALGDRSTVCDPRGDASHSQDTARNRPSGSHEGES